MSNSSVTPSGDDSGLCIGVHPLYCSEEIRRDTISPEDLHILPRCIESNAFLKSMKVRIAVRLKNEKREIIVILAQT